MKTFEHWVEKAERAGRAADMGSAVGYCVNALSTLAAERAAKRAAALDALARNDAEEVGQRSRTAESPGSFDPWAALERIRAANPAATATARVAAAREAAPEPVSVGHWGMH